MPAKTGHRGVFLIKPSGDRASWRARFRDPASGKLVFESLRGLATKAEREAWARKKCRELKLAGGGESSHEGTRTSAQAFVDGLAVARNALLYEQTRLLTEDEQAALAVVNFLLRVFNARRPPMKSEKVALKKLFRALESAPDKSKLRRIRAGAAEIIQDHAERLARFEEQGKGAGGRTFARLLIQTLQVEYGLFSEAASGLLRAPLSAYEAEVEALLSQCSPDGKTTHGKHSAAHVWVELNKLLPSPVEDSGASDDRAKNNIRKAIQRSR